jgi:hypothetical protein
MQMFWTFKLIFDVNIFAFFYLATVSATFFKKWAFFKSSGHTDEQLRGQSTDEVIECLSDFFAKIN